MSQFYTQNSGVNPPPPQVATSYVTDNGTAIPAANILNVLAEDVSDDNDDGIQTTANPNLSNNLFVQLTNRVSGSVVTNDATPTTLLNYNLGVTPSVIVIQGNIIAYNVTDNIGATYTLVGGVRSTGVVGFEIGSELKDVFEEPAMAAVDFTFGVLGNNAFIEVVGLPGKTINWSAFFIYRRQL